MVIHRYARVEWQEVAELSSTKRGEGGFGHTGNTQLKNVEKSDHGR